MEYARCPECDLPAEVLDRFSLESTDGSIAHVKIGCPAGHVLTPAAEDVSALDQSADKLETARMAFRRYVQQAAR